MRVVELGPRCTGSMKGTSTERPPGALSLAEAWRLGGFLLGGAVLSWKLLRPCALEKYGRCMGDVWEVYGRYGEV